MTKALVLNRYAEGGQGGRLLPLPEALARSWDFDAHVVQYAATSRLTKAEVSSTPIPMGFAMFDFDCPNHEPLTAHPEFAGALEKLPEGFQAYLTAGGFRAYTLLPEPFVISSLERWEEWRAFHAGLGQALSQELGVQFDPACSDPSRLFRLPNVKREGGKPCYPELYGRLSASGLQPVAVPVKTALPISTGAAAETMLGQCFEAAGWVRYGDAEKLTVRCPWAPEHSAGQDDLAVVYATDDQLGKFHCGHSHCVGRHTPEAVEALSGLPSVSPILERWCYVPEVSRPIDLNPIENVSQPSKGTALFELMTAEDMDRAEEALPWTVEGLVSVGEPTLIVGGAGSGKTSAMVALALAVASGQPVWGKFPVVRPGPVVHIDYEQGKTLRRTYRAFARGMGLHASELVKAGMLRIAPLPREQLLDVNVSDTHLSKVGRELITLCRGASLCVVNSLTAGTNKVNENDAKIAAVFNLLSRITELTGCAFVVLHHSGRGERKGARGSSAIDGAVQTIFEIEHRKGDAHTLWKHTKDRPAEGFQEPFTLTWGNDEGVQTLVAETIVAPEPNGPGAERPEDRIAQAILFIMENRGLTRQNQIVELVRGKRTTKLEVFKDLAIRGLIVSPSAGRWIISQGVVAPRERPDGVRSEDE